MHLTFHEPDRSEEVYRPSDRREETHAGCIGSMLIIIAAFTLERMEQSGRRTDARPLLNTYRYDTSRSVIMCDKNIIDLRDI